MGTFKRTAISLALVAIFAGNAYGLNDRSPRAMALGQSYTALARGPEAVAWNPANLGLKSSPGFKWNLFGAGATLAMENNSFSVQDYNDNFTDDTHVIGDSEKDKLLGDIDSKGLKFNLDAEPMLSLGVPVNGGVAFPLPWGLKSAVTTGAVVGVEGEVPKDMFALFLKGNEFGQSYDLADWDGSGWLLGSLNFAAAKPWLPAQLKPFLREFSLGGTLKITGGAYGEVVESGGDGFSSELQGADLEVFGTSQFGGGIGFGLDFGAAGVTKDGKTTVSLGVLNLLDVMSWSISARQDSFFASASDLRVTRALDEDVVGIEDILDNQDVDGDGDKDFNIKLSEESFDRSLPAMIRLGAAHRLIPRLTLVGNYDQAFSSGFGITTTPRLSAGAEYRLVPWFPARAGISAGGRSSGSSIGFAFGPFSVYHMQLELFDFAFVTRGGFFPGIAKGSAISLMLFRFNLI
jgi:hypothetical protein